MKQKPLAYCRHPMSAPHRLDVSLPARDITMLLPDGSLVHAKESTATLAKLRGVPLLTEAEFYAKRDALMRGQEEARIEFSRMIRELPLPEFDLPASVGTLEVVAEDPTATYRRAAAVAALVARGISRKRAEAMVGEEAA